MSAIKKLNEPAKEKVLTIYETIFHEGEEKGILIGRQEGKIEKDFLVFKNGIPMGFDLDTLIKLTGVVKKTALSWKKLLDKNPDADFPGL